MKRNRELSHAPAWMSLGNVMGSERSQSQSLTYFVIPLIRNANPQRQQVRVRQELRPGQGERGVIA